MQKSKDIFYIYFTHVLHKVMKLKKIVILLYTKYNVLVINFNSFLLINEYVPK